MKLTKGIFTFILGLVLSLNLLPAQPSASSARKDSLDRAADLKTMLEALTTVKPVAFDSLPKNRRNQVMSVGFLSMLHPEWPPLPGNFYKLDVWPLGEGHFVLDDRDLDYAALQAAADLDEQFAPQMRMMSSSLTSYAYGNPVYLTNLVVTSSGGKSAAFDIAGGTNNVPYDIQTTTNLLSVWNWLGIGYTSNRYTFNSQPTDTAFYRLAKPSKTMTVGWGGNVYGQTDVPLATTNLLMVAGGYGYNLGLSTDGSVIGWGNSSVSGWVPTNLVGNVAMIASAWNHSVALLTNGTVIAWGYNNPGIGLDLTNVPANLTNATVISAQGLHSLALRQDGTVVAWGANIDGQCNVPTALSNVTAIAAGGYHSLAVSNGFVVAWGKNNNGQCNVPAGLSNVLDVAASDCHSLALKADGTVVAWGNNAYGQSVVPAGLSNVVAIAAGGGVSLSDPYMGAEVPFSLALKKDGAMVAWGGGILGKPVQGLNNVIGISGGTFHALAVRTGPPTPVVTLEPVDQFQVAGGSVSFNAKGRGLYGVTYQWQTNGVNLAGATNATLTLTNVQAAQEASYRVIVNDNGGYGSIASSNASLTAINPPVILSQSPLPTNQLAAFQTNLALSVIVSAPGQANGFPVSYRWQFNGTNISGATTNTYAFLVDTPKLGAYAVIASNAAGSVTSLVWQVTMTYTGSYIAPGTLAYHLSTNAVGRTNGISDIYHASFELDNWTYASYYGTNLALLTNAVWSTNFWLKGVQGLSATCIGYSNGLGAQGLVTMISPRHYLMAAHVGGVYMLAFLDTNNVIHWRTTMQRVSVGDTAIGIIDADLPPSVGFLSLMPTNYSNYIPLDGRIVQGLGMNQDARIFGQPLSFGFSGGISWNFTLTAPFGLTTNWNVGIRPGDSSNPVRALIGNQLVLVSGNGSAGSGPDYASQFDVINEKMHFVSTNNGVGSDYQLTPFVLTNWPTIH